jgi:hypothetical protein
MFSEVNYIFYKSSKKITEGVKTQKFIEMNMFSMWDYWTDILLLFCKQEMKY